MAMCAQSELKKGAWGGQVKDPTARVQHEASTSKIGKDQIFYFQQRGIDCAKAVSTLMGAFCCEVFEELPLELASEVNQLMRSKLADWRACLGWCFPNVFENLFQKHFPFYAEFCTFVLKVVRVVCQHLVGFYTKNKQLIVQLLLKADPLSLWALARALFGPLNDAKL